MLLFIYYGSQRDFAKKFSINEGQLSEYINGTILISVRTAQMLQDKAKINSNYLFNGNYPMLLDKTIKPIRQTPQSVSVVHQAEFERSIGGVQSYIIETKGLRDVVIPQGKTNIANVTVGGLVMAGVVSVQSPEFVDKYKSVFPLKLNCYIVLEDGLIANGVDVLVSIDNNLYLANARLKIFEKHYEETFVDCATNQVIQVVDKDSVDVHGAYYSTIIKGRLK